MWGGGGEYSTLRCSAVQYSAADGIVICRCVRVSACMLGSKRTEGKGSIWYVTMMMTTCCTVLYSTSLLYTVLFCTVLYCSVVCRVSHQHMTLHGMVWHGMVWMGVERTTEWTDGWMDGCEMRGCVVCLQWLRNEEMKIDMMKNRVFECAKDMMN